MATSHLCGRWYRCLPRHHRDRRRRGWRRLSDQDRWSRREILRKGIAGGALLAGGTLVGRSTAAAHEPGGHGAESAGNDGYPGLGSSSIHDEDSAALYGHGHEPPSALGPKALDAATFPPQPSSGHQTIVFDVVEQRIEVGAGIFFDAWTYNGTVPGPIVRATEGDHLTITLNNLTGHPHNLHFHGAHLPEMDGWEPIPPGQSFTYEIVAGPTGAHPYHCHTAPLATHIARGLYGWLIVDPVDARPAATEVALVLSGFETPDGVNAVMAWNGVAGYYQRYPIRVPVGEPVRAYVLNMTEFEPVGGFHLHAQTFEVYPAGMGAAPLFRTDTITLGQAERAIVEFTLPTVGRYMFHPHQHHLADRGAMGWFAAV